MKRFLLLLGATALAASPAVAQHAGHNMPGMTMPAPEKKPAPKKKAAAKKPPAKKASAKKPAGKAAAKKAPAKKPAARKPAAGHEQHDMSQTPGMEMPAGHDMSQMPQQEGQTGHEGHDMSTMPGMQMPGHDMSQMPPATAQPGQHAGHQMGAPAAPEPPVGPPPPEALQGPENAADTVYGNAAMEPSRAFLLTREHGRITVSKWLVDQLETRVKDGRNGYFLNAEGWIGGDIDKLWLKTEVEGNYGEKPEQAELQALWSHAIDPWFNLQTGVRLDAKPDKRARLVVGVQGLAPYWIEVDAAAFLSDKGDITARFEAEHDVRITQKLILQPRAELDFALQDIPREGIGSGLSVVEFGARLRYAFVPNFAPYIGVNYEQAIGDTARFRRAEGEDPGGLQFVVGLRAWF